LEKSAFALESWLEEKLKHEGDLDSDALSASLSLDNRKTDNGMNDNGENIQQQQIEDDKNEENSGDTALSITPLPAAADDQASRPMVPSQPTEPSPKPGATLAAASVTPSATDQIDADGRDDGSSSSSSNATSNGNNLFGKSITSTFFKALLSQAPDGAGDGSNPPPPTLPVDVENFVEGDVEKEIDLDDVASESDEEGEAGAIDGERDDASRVERVVETKQVKSAAVMSQMRSRLTAMGILHGERGQTPDPTKEEEEKGGEDGLLLLAPPAALESSQTNDSVTQTKNASTFAPARVKQVSNDDDLAGSDTEDEEEVGGDGRDDAVEQYEGTLGAFPSDNTLIAALKVTLNHNSPNYTNY
jgi:hypothetical protein